MSYARAACVALRVGLEAWKDGGVPCRVTTCVRMAWAYADVVRRIAREAPRLPPPTNGTAGSHKAAPGGDAGTSRAVHVYVLEVGAGSCKFGYHLGARLLELQRRDGADASCEQEVRRARRAVVSRLRAIICELCSCLRFAAMSHDLVTHGAAVVLCRQGRAVVVMSDSSAAAIHGAMRHPCFRYAAG